MIQYNVVVYKGRYLLLFSSLIYRSIAATDTSSMLSLSLRSATVLHKHLLTFMFLRHRHRVEQTLSHTAQDRATFRLGICPLIANISSYVSEKQVKLACIVFYYAWHSLSRLTTLLICIFDKNGLDYDRLCNAQRDATVICKRVLRRVETFSTDAYNWSNRSKTIENVKFSTTFFV